MTRAQQKPTAPVNHLSGVYYGMPAFANGTFTRKQVQETLLATDGWISVHGRPWRIVAKHIGAGIYRVTLEAMS